MHELVDRGASRKQQDDPGQYPLPRPSVQTPLVDRAFGNAVPDQLAHGRDTVWEGRSQARCATARGCIHGLSVLTDRFTRGRLRKLVSGRVSGKPLSCNLVA
jgi:hypothetical protein